jgi:hypothetical protein
MTDTTLSKPLAGSGADFWRTNAVNHGIDAAITICNSYLDMNLKREHQDDERQFCRELFKAMYEATVERSDPARSVYPYNFREAKERGEINDYHESRRRNNECANGIYGIISDSCYSPNYYNLEIAAAIAILRYGFDRVVRVLAFNIQKHEYDGRYSSANKRWAGAFTMPEQAFSGSYLNSHPCLVDSFADYVREIYNEYKNEGDEKA